MTVNEPTLRSKESKNSLDEIINSQKQLDDELQQLKNRYSRYSQLVSFQQQEEDYLLKNKEKVNSKRVSLSLKRKKDVTYGLMPHDDILAKEEEHEDEKQSFESMTKTANAFLSSIEEKHNALKKKDFELLHSPISIKEDEEEKQEKNTEKEPEKEMNRLCDLVQSLLSEAQGAIDSKPELNHPDIGKEEDPEITIPQRVQSLNSHHTSFNDTSSIRNKHLSIMTDTTAIAQPLSPVNKRCGDDFDDFDDFGMSKYDELTSPYNASTTTNDEFMKSYPPKFYPPPPEFYYGPPVGYPPYFDPAYGPIPPYMWEEFQKHKMGLNSDESSGSEAAVAVNSRKENQEIIKTTTTTTTTTEVKKDKKEIIEGKALVKKRRRHKHRKHIRPVDADGNICDSDSCPVHSKSLVKKKQSSKLFKAQFGSDTQLFLSFFASFFVTSILVTISCLWSVIQVMAGNVNDKNLSRLLQSSSENAIRNNKKRIDLILDKESSESTESEFEEEESQIEEIDEDDVDDEGNEENEESSNKFITATSASDDEGEELDMNSETISLS